MENYEKDRSKSCNKENKKGVKDFHVLKMPWDGICLAGSEIMKATWNGATGEKYKIMAGISNVINSTEYDLVLAMYLLYLSSSSILPGLSYSKLITEPFLNFCLPQALDVLRLFCLYPTIMTITHFRKSTVGLEKGQRKVAPNWPFVLWVKRYSWCELLHRTVL